MLLVISFFYFVIYNISKAYEDAHKDGFENPFQ